MDKIIAQMLLKLNGIPLFCTCGSQITSGKVVEVYKNYILLEAVHPGPKNNAYVVVDLNVGRVIKSFLTIEERIDVLLLWRKFKKQNDLL